MKLFHLLQEKADSKRKGWWENYVKGSAPFLGVKMADIRSLVHSFEGFVHLGSRGQV